MADLLFIQDGNVLFIKADDVLSRPGVVRTVYDPTAGTGGMLSVAGEYLEKHGARVVMGGQELNDESYAICKADMLIKGQDVSNIKPGDTLAAEGHPGQTFDYMLSNPALRRRMESLGPDALAPVKRRSRKGFTGYAGAFIYQGKRRGKTCELFS